MNNLIVEKIKEEKRRRNQAYQSLDYLLKHISYFDFFSKDAFAIVKRSMVLSLIFDKRIIETEILLLPFFHPKNRVNQLLKNFEINQELVSEIVSNENATYEHYSLLKDLFYGPDYDEEKYEKEIEFSHEVKLILKKAAENSIYRFKTPIISSEILFLTLMEDKNSKAAHIIRRMIKNETTWYLIRYELMKKIHSEESIIKNEISINQHYFAYLLKRELTDFQLDRVIENESFQTTVSLFRNTLISNVLRQNIFNNLLNDVKKSIKMNKSRRYSKKH
jgi:hypothetical protein